MQHLWALGAPASVREVLDGLAPARPLAYTTVMTVLDNLHSKGLVRREKRGRAYAYVAATSREEHTAALIDDVLAESDDRTAALMHVVGRLSADDAARLLEALHERVDGS